MTYKSLRLDKDPFGKNAQYISKLHHEVFLLLKLLQTKPQVKTMNNNSYDLYYSVLKNGMEKKMQMINLKILRMIIVVLMILFFLIIILEEKIIMKY